MNYNSEIISRAQMADTGHAAIGKLRLAIRELEMAYNLTTHSSLLKQHAVGIKGLIDALYAQLDKFEGITKENRATRPN